MSYKNSNLVNIIVDINYKDLLKAGKDYICDHNLLNIVEEFAYNYYLNLSKSLIENEEEDDNNDDEENLV